MRDDLPPLRLWRRRVHIAYALIVAPMLAAYLLFFLSLNFLSDTTLRAEQVRQEYEGLIGEKRGE